MASDQRGARPVARVLFIVPEGGAQVGDENGAGRKDKFVEIAAAWRTEKGGYRFTLDSIPAPLLAGRAVTFILSKIEEPTSEPPQQQRRQGR